MNLNINLFVHGVPLGQKIWGPRGDDYSYLSSFYGPKWDVPEAMKIDVMTFGGIKYCYYTLVKGLNVYDSQGRAGSYFALTLRINAFYSDIQNLYGILKAAYEKICVGLCIQETKDSAKYILADFQNVDTGLKELENRILGYISEFSVADDIVSLDSIVNAQSSTCTFNLHECTKEIATKAIKQYGKLIVSSWYLSESALQTVARYKEEAFTTVQKAQQDIELQKKTSQQKIDEITLQSKNEIETIQRHAQEELSQYKENNRQQLSQIQEDYELRIADIKSRYADVDSRIVSLNETIREKNKEISELRKACNKKDKELQKLNGNNQISQKSIHTYISDIDTTQGNKIKTWLYKYKNEIIIVIISLLSILLVFLMIWILFYPTQGETIPTQKKKQEKTSKVQDSINPCFSVIEFTNSNNVAVLGRRYHVAFLDSSIDTDNGRFESDEFLIQDKTFKAKPEFVGRTGTISYWKDTAKIASIIIQIKDSV